MTRRPAATSTGNPDHVVVVGSGSAGRRHVAAFRAALPATRITVVRRSDSNQPTEVLTRAGADTTDTVAEAVADGVDIGVVAGPAPLHEGAATELLAAGADLLVEKPLTDQPGSAARLVARAAAAQRSLVVGYHLRVGDTVPALRRAIEAGAIGTPTSFDLQVGQHLSAWRAGTDPASSVSARADLGGGVLLELSHELDGLRYLLGDVLDVDAVLGHGGAPTDGVVETVADLRLHTAGGAAGTVHLDMVSDPPRRTWRIGGADGELVADLLTGRISVLDTRTDRTRELQGPVDPGERDRAGTRLVANVVEVHAGRSLPVCTGADGVAALEIVAAARRSAASGRAEPVTSATSTVAGLS